LKHGRGKYVYSNGDRYEGGWQDDAKHGQGKYFYDDGSVYEGEWKNDERSVD